MGNGFPFSGKGDNEENEEEQAEKLNAWRPQAESHAHGAIKRKKLSSNADDSSEEGSNSASDEASSAPSESDDQSSAADQKSQDGEGSQDSGSKEDDDSQAHSSDVEETAQAEKLRDAKKKKKIVVRMEFDPLLSLHEQIGTVVEEPKDLFSHGKHIKKHQKMEQSAIEDAQAASRAKAKAAAEWLADMNLDDCILSELAQALGEDPDDLRYALVQSGRFEVDDEGKVARTVLQKIFDVMESDIETLQEVLEKLVDEATADEVKDAIQHSQGELKLKLAQDVELIEHVDLEAEAQRHREDDKERRAQEKEERRKKRKKGKKGADEDEESSSDDEDDGFTAANREAERKALEFRRVQVRRKIEEFLKLYTKGQNLTKINAKGKRYHRRVYVDTSKKALVVQGASGPKFFPFQNMREVDIDTRTTKEGRVETLVVCAIEKGGRVVKELNLAFPDPAKANTFVNCVTLFALALRNAAEQGKIKK